MINGYKYLLLNSREEILKDLHYPETALYLFRTNLETGETELCGDDKYNELDVLPDIKEVIEYYGYDTHDFNECLEIYKDIFEHDDAYLPFDNDEIYISKNDRYEGCCGKNDTQFKTKEWFYYFTVLPVI